MRYDGVQRLGWAILSDMLWITAKVLSLMLRAPLWVTELARNGSAQAYFRSLPDRSSQVERWDV